MARVFPFQPYRYSAKAGAPENLVTQPYDKITPAMQKRYLSLSPYNLVRVILGERLPSDDGFHNVYTRAAQHLNEWTGSGILEREGTPSFYAYTQEFEVPDTGECLTRKGFIGLGAVEDYSAGTVHRHEQTLSGPKKDRMEVLRHTKAHFGQIFMLYPDPEMAIDRLLDEEAAREPDVAVRDEDGTLHRLWRISQPARVNAIERHMVEKKLLIADGHHRYETALAFSRDNAGLTGSDKVMMTFVNMHSPGLKILATHRVVSNLDGFDAEAAIQKLGAKKAGSLDDLKKIFSTPAPDKIRIGIAVADLPDLYLMERPRGAGELDVAVLHEELLGGVLGIGEEAVREEKYLKYVRGLDAAVERVRSGESQIALLLEPTTMEQVATVAFGGGVMPQKSTDFYPKLLSGLTIYKLGS
jgi:uncharacterized protein (DUF1015 family)